MDKELVFLIILYMFTIFSWIPNKGLGNANFSASTSKKYFKETFSKIPAQTCYGIYLRKERAVYDVKILCFEREIKMAFLITLMKVELKGKGYL